MFEKVEYLDIQRGWYPIINELSNIIHNKFPTCKFTSVKEKFGTLRVYYNHNESDRKLLDEIIRNAQKESRITCDKCGIKDNVSLHVISGWHMTRCNKCVDSNVCFSYND